MISYSPLLPGTESVMNAFAKRIVEQARASSLDLQKVRAIEVGSGPGGLTFALAAHCGAAASIIGVDHSAHAIDVAKRVQKGEAVQAVMAGDGSTTSTVSITSNNPKAMVAFRNADPMSLPAEMGGFDLAVLHDVIDTLASPNALLGRLGGVRGLVRSKGLLVVSSAYQWKEERTPKDLWLGGAGTKAEDALVERLGEEFTHLRTEPMLQVWPEGERQLRGVTYSVSYFLRK
jgi:SAM-dependent methyltransferase